MTPDPRPLIPAHLAWRIRVTFAGKLPPKEYITPDIRSNDPGWGSEIFNRPIEMMEFFLPTGHKIILSGMEQYNFFVEAVQSTRSREKAEIQAFWFCGKLPGEDIVEMWRIGDGRVIRDRNIWGKEWGGGATKGWKRGLPGRVISELVKHGAV
jgi:hypothetical protein